MLKSWWRVTSMCELWQTGTSCGHPWTGVTSLLISCHLPNPLSPLSHYLSPPPKPRFRVSPIVFCSTESHAQPWGSASYLWKLERGWIAQCCTHAILQNAQHNAQCTQSSTVPESCQLFPPHQSIQYTISDISDLDYSIYHCTTLSDISDLDSYLWKLEPGKPTKFD